MGGGELEAATAGRGQEDVLVEVLALHNTKVAGRIVRSDCKQQNFLQMPVRIVFHKLFFLSFSELCSYISSLTKVGAVRTQGLTQGH